MCRHILQSPDNPKYSVIKKATLLKKLAARASSEAVLQAVGFVTRRGDDDGRQIDWLVLDVVNETMTAPSTCRSSIAPQDGPSRAERRPLVEAGVSRLRSASARRTGRRSKFHDQHPASGKNSSAARRSLPCAHTA